jgi:hypothetical protein
MAQTPAKKGHYMFLKGETSFTIKFEYDDMIVGKKLTEEEYINQKVEDYNEDEPGKGDKWKEAWFNARDERYEPKFEDLINKSMEKIGMTATEDTKAKYMLIVKTVYTEPGFNVGVMKKPAFVNFVFIFMDTESGEEVANYTLSKVPGSQSMGFDYDVGSRIAESYAKGGKMLGSYIYKYLK